MDKPKITSDFHYSLTLAFLGMTTSSYLQFICTRSCLQRLTGAFRDGHSQAWLPPLVLTSLQMAMCISCLKISFSKANKDLKSIDPGHTETEILQIGRNAQNSRKHPLKTSLDRDAVEVQSVEKKWTGESFDNFKRHGGPKIVRNDKYGETSKIAECRSTAIDTANKELFGILLCSHTSVTYLLYFCTQSNVSVSPEQLLPFIASFLYLAVMGRRQLMASIFSILVVTVASVWFNIFERMSWDGYLLLLMTSVLLTSRNMVMKIFHEQSIIVELRSNRTGLFWIFFASILNLALYLTFNIRWMEPCILGFLSSTFFLVSSYISAVVILRRVSLISHAVLDISKHLLIAIVLAVCYNNRLWLVSLPQLAICSCGIIVYAFSGKEQPTSQVSLSEQSTRLLFVVFLTVIGGVIFHNIPVKISQRDLANFKILHLHDFIYFLRRTFNNSPG